MTRTTTILIAVLIATPAFTADPPDIQRGVVGVRLLERGAVLMEDFNAPEVDTKRWRLWHSDQDAVSFGVEDGRFVIRGQGSIGHNGLWSLEATRTRDVVLIGRMDAKSAGPEPHELLMHLCGGDAPRSPDHWVEVSMRDAGDGKAGFRILAALPNGLHPPQRPDLVLERPGDGRGFLTRITRNAGTGLTDLEVRDADGKWRTVAGDVPLPLRTTHCEVKLRRSYGDDSGTKTTGWFDDVRMYPRAATHPVMVRLATSDRRRVYSRGASGEEWPPVVKIRGKEHKLDALSVELWTGDGKEQVAAVRSTNLGDYMLDLKDAPWDVYPVAALLRVNLEGEPLGEAAIELDGLEGLYPDDVYELMLE